MKARGAEEQEGSNKTIKEGIQERKQDSKGWGALKEKKVIRFKNEQGRILEVKITYKGLEGKLKEGLKLKGKDGNTGI